MLRLFRGGLSPALRQSHAIDLTRVVSLHLDANHGGLYPGLGFEGVRPFDMEGGPAFGLSQEQHAVDHGRILMLGGQAFPVIGKRHAVRVTRPPRK